MPDRFKARTGQLYATAKRRGVALFSLEELRAALLEKLMRRPLCRYCNSRLSEANVSLDHKTPLARGGRNDLANVEFICRSDNKAKGPLTDREYEGLLHSLDELGASLRNPTIRDYVLGSMRTASSFRIGANRRAKKR